MVSLEESLLRAASRMHALQAEIDQLAPAAAYMQQLIDLIERYQLQDEWRLFLRRAEFPDRKI